MTAIVGVLCKDGAVIGSDSSATFVVGQFKTIEQPTEDKIKIIGEHVIVAGTGPVGLGQRFCALVQRDFDLKLFKASPHIEIGKKLCSEMLMDLEATGIKTGSYGALVAFQTNEKPYLCEFGQADFQPEFKTESLWYCSMGSSQLITDPFLGFMREVFWDGGRPSVNDAIFAVTWTLDHAISVNPGGVNGPVHVAVLEKSQNGKLHARKLEVEELDQHRQNVKEAILHLRSYRSKHKPEASVDVPDVPKP